MGAAGAGRQPPAPSQSATGSANIIGYSLNAAPTPSATAASTSGPGRPIDAVAFGRPIVSFARPGWPIDPVEPGRPVDPVEPGRPIDPVEPGRPIGPVWHQAGR